MQQETPPFSKCSAPVFRSQGERLQEAWIEFLQPFTWDLFVTLTFREEPGHAEVAEKQYRLLVSMVNRELYGRQWAKHGDGISYVLASEKQQRGTTHYHALWGQTKHSQDDAERRFKWMEAWNEIAGFARIYPIEEEKAVRCYVSKYVIKGGELTMGGALQAPPLPFMEQMSCCI